MGILNHDSGEWVYPQENPFSKRKAEPWTDVDGIPKRQWLATVREVRGAPPDAGLDVVSESCPGGYCKRHHLSREVRYKTADGLRLCEACGVIWAARRKLGLKHEIDDL